MKNRIALILPYYGTLPDYFDLWLLSAGHNDGLFDYLLFTDCDMSHYQVPNNVIVIKSSLENLASRINAIMPFKVRLYSSYKICEYRPLFGRIYERYLVGYDFWGHCDPDVIWGDGRKFISDEMLDSYDRLYSHGHLCIYRNTDKINDAVINDYLYYGVLEKTGLTIKDIYGHRYAAHFDEGESIKRIMKSENVSARMFDSIDYADIYVGKKEFVYLVDNDESRMIPYFVWKNGSLYGGNDEERTEFLYVHLQKRKMQKTDEIDEYMDGFIIIPNQFMRYHDISVEEEQSFIKPDREYELNFRKWCLKSKINHIFEGALWLRIKKKMHRLFK